MENVRVVYSDMPATVKGFVMEDCDCYHTVVLNSRLSREQNVDSYIHELEHIGCNDFDDHDADVIERRRHAI